MSFATSMFENPEALAKLAALNPMPDLSEAGGSGGSGGATARKGGRTIASSGGKTVGERLGGEFKAEADPDWLKERDAFLDTLAKRHAAEYESRDTPAISVTLPDGKVIEGKAWVTSPLDIATGISKGLAQNVVVANVKYSKRYEGGVAVMTGVDADPDAEEEAADAAEGEFELWDLSRPLEGDCNIELLKFDNEKAKEVFWHSSAHILGEALESLYGAKLTHGPPTESGFFYDSYMGQTCALLAGRPVGGTHAPTRRAAARVVRSSARARVPAGRAPPHRFRRATRRAHAAPLSLTLCRAHPRCVCASRCGSAPLGWQRCRRT
jgi:hypothetical protein